MNNNKQSMKLYTEKEVDKAMLLYLKGIPRMIILEQHITPIELPSDEKIEQIASDYRSTSEFCDIENFEDGAVFSIKWLRNKIQGGNK